VECPDGEVFVLDVSQLQTLLRKSFNIRIDPDRSRVGQS